MPFFWVGGLVFSLLSNLQAGACGLCEDVFDPESTLALLEQERATIAIGWPHFGKALAEHPTRPSRDLSALCGGNMPGLLPPEQVPDDPELRANALGMTETCGAHTWGGEGALPESLRGSFGPAIGGFEHRIVDPSSGAALPPGELGEIHVRGPRLMLGLHKREREAVFAADGWYATGDAGFFDAAGVLYFKGRLGDMIKTGGANVSPPEVEAILLAQPEVKAAQIVGLPDPDRGETVVAAVVLEEEQTASAERDGSPRSLPPTRCRVACSSSPRRPSCPRPTRASPTSAGSARCSASGPGRTQPVERSLRSARSGGPGDRRQPRLRPRHGAGPRPGGCQPGDLGP
jgi:acyl-CoA synthetase (AMP-forming)/AMP-acid ligase II